MQKKLFTAQATPESFQRTGPGVVVTKLEKRSEDLNESAPPLPFEVEKRGGVIIPAASYNDCSGPSHFRAVPQSFGGGNQLHLLSGEGEVSYEFPANLCFHDD